MKKIPLLIILLMILFLFTGCAQQRKPQKRLLPIHNSYESAYYVKKYPDMAEIFYSLYTPSYEANQYRNRMMEIRGRELNRAEIRSIYERPHTYRFQPRLHIGSHPRIIY